MIKIEKGVPIPKATIWATGVERVNYPFHWMIPGDSFVVLDDKNTSVRAYVSKLNTDKTKKFIVRKVKGGVRCWRVK